MLWLLGEVKKRKGICSKRTAKVLLKEETVIREHTRKKEAALEDLSKGLKVPAALVGKGLAGLVRQGLPGQKQLIIQIIVLRKISPATNGSAPNPGGGLSIFS